MKNRIVLSSAALVLIGVSYLLLRAGSEQVSRVMIPSELLKSAAFAGDIRLAGQVGARRIQYQVEPEMQLDFVVIDRKDDKGQLNQAEFVVVRYYGLKPDMFTEGRDVIVEGTYKEGVFQAHKLMTQCPSKYEPPQPEK